MSRGLVGIGTLVVFAGVTGVLVFGVATGPVGATTPADNASLGADISSFMQASDVETADNVEEGRFEVAMNRTEDSDERRALIRARQARLEERSERLRSQRETLGETPDVRNRSVATGISIGAAGLERSVNETERRAQAADVPTERFSELRESARAVRGPDVAGLARGVGRPPNAGPPDGTPPANRSGTPGPRERDEQVPEPSRSPIESDAPTDARDVDQGGSRGSDGGSLGGESPDDGPPGADAAPGVDSNNDDGVNGTNSPTGNGEHGPPTAAGSSGNPGTDGRPLPPGSDAKKPPENSGR
ncbi:MAG: hypothetical protein ACQET5_00290 [Halobacteriota archaeon]|uniref:hypothetical protein n=1 Tax=Natronomonas sp. TaxID=2184060 RepID=UPI00397593F3